MSPQDKYWLVQIETVEEDDKGKIKRNKEKQQHIQSGYVYKHIRKRYNLRLYPVKE